MLSNIKDMRAMVDLAVERAQQARDIPHGHDVRNTPTFARAVAPGGAAHSLERAANGAALSLEGALGGAALALEGAADGAALALIAPCGDALIAP